MGSQERLADNPFAYRIEDQLRNTVQVQLAQDMRAMSLHREETEIQRGSHFLVGSSFGRQLQDLALARAEQIISVLYLVVFQLTHEIFLQQSSDGRAEERSPYRDSADGRDQVGFRG